MENGTKYLLGFLGIFAAAVAALFAYQYFNNWKMSKSAIDDNSAEVQAQRDMLSEDFIRASSSAKVAYAEYFASMGKMPQDNKEIGLYEPPEYRGQSLTRMEVMPGKIVLSFDAKSGVDGGQIELIPDASSVAMGVQWQCRTASYPNVARFARGCVYIKQ